MKIQRDGEQMWKFQPFPACSYSFDFTEAEIPCWFHRVLQRFLLGFKWTKHDE